MRNLPYQKLSFMFYPILSLFLFSIISCSSIDLSKIILTDPEKQPTSENGEVFSATDEKQRNMSPLPNHLEDESEINIIRKALRERDEENLRMQEELIHSTQLKNTTDDKIKELTQLNSKLLQNRNLENIQHNSVDFLKRELAEKNELVSRINTELDELELKSELEKIGLTTKLNALDLEVKRGEILKTGNLEISKERNNLRARKDSLDLREKELESKERSLRLREKSITASFSAEETITIDPKDNNLLAKEAYKKPNDLNNKPSFNCNYAYKWDEKIVCNSPILSSLDRKLHGAFENAVKSNNSDKSKNDLILHQRAWLKIRHQCKEEKNEKILCLKRVYVNQISSLQGQHKKNLKLHSLAKAQPSKKINSQASFSRSVLFQKLPINNFKKYNEKIILDEESSLLWTKFNFFQKEGSFPETAGECQEWAAQMRREEYGGVNNWRVPSHVELGQLGYLYGSLIGGKSENFAYWGTSGSGFYNFDIYKFKNQNDQEPDDYQSKANCRLVANIKNRN